MRSLAAVCEPPCSPVTSASPCLAEELLRQKLGKLYISRWGAVVAFCSYQELLEPGSVHAEC